MTELAFSVAGARAEPYAAVPTLAFGLHVEAPGQAVHALALRCQIRIEPQRRRDSPGEEKRLLELFGETPRWGDTVPLDAGLHSLDGGDVPLLLFSGTVFAKRGEGLAVTQVRSDA